MVATLEAVPAVGTTDARPTQDPAGVAAMLGAAALLSACGGGDSPGSAELPAAMLAFHNATSNPALLKVSAQTIGTRSTVRAVAPPDATAFMDWAERFYPAYFPGHQANISSDPYVYRYYPGTSNYLGVVGNDIYLLGPATGGQLVKAGILADFASAVNSNYATARPASNEAAVRFLLQAQFSASDYDIGNLLQKSYGSWLQEQIDAPATTTGFDWLNTRGYNAISNDTNYYDNTYPGDYMIWNQLMTSSDAVRKRMALALSEYFVVSLYGVEFNWRSHAMAAWWDMLVANTFGNFRKLLEDVTLNAAMGYYLNTKGNLKEDVARGRVPDENYGREVMQLFTIGLYQLNIDGTEQRDAEGKKLESYTQNDISNIARVFTGWDFDQSQNVDTIEPVKNRKIPNTAFTRLPMRINAANHSTLAATFLGTTVPANTDGPTALKITLDALFNHPNVGPFFGKQMIQRLVTSNPSQAYVARVATAFNDNGAGVRGDLKAVFTAILLDEEARSPVGLTQANFGKLREPMLRMVQWGRSFGLISAQGSWKMGDLSNPANQLGQSPLRSLSVFNFFRPGYVPPSSAMSNTQTLAPEFQLVNESSVGGYLNYMQNVIRNGIYVNAPNVPNSASNTTNGYDITPAYSAELALVMDTTALVARLNLLLCAGQLSSANQALIISAINTIALTASSNDSARRNRVAAAVLMVMASSDYLIQK